MRGLCCWSCGCIHQVHSTIIIYKERKTICVLSHRIRFVHNILHACDSYVCVCGCVLFTVQMCDAFSTLTYYFLSQLRSYSPVKAPVSRNRGGALFSISVTGRHTYLAHSIFNHIQKRQSWATAHFLSNLLFFARKWKWWKRILSDIASCLGLEMPKFIFSICLSKARS